MSTSDQSNRPSKIFWHIAPALALFLALALYSLPAI